METLKLKNISFEYKCEIIAQVVHATNRQYSECIGGRPVNPTWEQLPQVAKESLVEAIAETIRNPKTPAESHSAWCLARKSQGWEHDVRLDQNRKTHPNLVPFAELPFEEQLKDGLFLGITSIFVSALGIKSLPHEFDELVDEHVPEDVTPTNDEIITYVEELIEAEKYDTAYEVIVSLNDGEVKTTLLATLDMFMAKLNPKGKEASETTGSEKTNSEDSTPTAPPLTEIPEDGTAADLSKDEGAKDVIEADIESYDKLKETAQESTEKVAASAVAANDIVPTMEVTAKEAAKPNKPAKKSGKK